MKRFLALAALVASISLAASTSEAGDWHHGSHGVHHGHHGGHGFAHGGGYAVSPYSNYGYGAFYGGQSYGYGNGYGYQPQFRSGYAPRYQSYGRQQHGGLHIDVGPFHVLGIGGHHH